MFNRSQAMASPEFAPTEAETIVKQIRRDYRLAAQMKESGETLRAARARRRADDALEAMRKRLERVLDRQISNRMRFASDTERVDALADLQSHVILAIRNTSETPSALYWESRFNRCVKTRTIDVLRAVRKRYFDKPTFEEGDAPSGAREITFSALDRKNTDAVSGLTSAERFIDTNVARDMDAMLDSDTIEKLSAELGGKQREYLLLLMRHYNGETWEEIAESEQIKPDTARKRGQAVLLSLRKIATA